jgi:hypothetical protein
MRCILLSSECQKMTMWIKCDRRCASAMHRDDQGPARFPPMLQYFDSIIVAFGFFFAIDKPLFITRNRSWHVQRSRSCSARTIAPLGFLSTIATDDNDDSAIARRHSLIESMAKFYVDMVDPVPHRFYSTCVPSTGVRCHEPRNPMRDLAAGWDASKLLLYHRRSRERCGEEEESENHDDILKRAISTTVEHYQRGLIPVTTPATTSGSTTQTSSCLQLSSDHLQEASHIGHSAMMILAVIGSFQVSSSSSSLSALQQQRIIEALAWGILSMQRDDGAFCISFDKGQQDDNVYTDIEFYPGEAMVALAEVYHLGWAFPGPATAFTTTLDNAILLALRRAFLFYSDYYFHQGTSNGANYSIWQIQAFTRLFRLLRSSQPTAVGSISTNDDSDDDDHDDNLLQSIGFYVVALAETVLGSNAWKYQLARGPSFYANLNTIEIACGLDALGDAMLLDMADITAKSDESFEQIWPQRVDEAVRFFEWTLSKVPPEAVRGTGGLGFGGTVVREQRLDVTGHALSALIKLQSSSSSSTNANAR